MGKVLVTGATGHLGTNIVRRLVASGRDVKALIRASSPLEGFAGMDIETAVGDLLDAASLAAAMRGCDAVYHAAAVYRTWAKDPETIIVPTVEGSRNVLMAAHDWGIERVVYVSTVGTVGFTPDPSSPLDETAFNTHSQSAYLRAKRQAEQDALAFHEKTGLPIVFVLPGILIGQHFSRPTPSLRFVLDYLNQGAPVYFEMGLSLVDADDVARGAMAAETRGRVGDRYILAGENVTLKEMYDRLARLTGLPGPGSRVPNAILPALASFAELATTFTNKPPMLSHELIHDYRGRYIFLSSEKARRELGYNYLDADDALRRTVEWAAHRGFVAESRRKRMKVM